MADAFGTKTFEELALDSATQVMIAEDELLRKARDDPTFRDVEGVEEALGIQHGKWKQDCAMYISKFWKWDKQHAIDALEERFPGLVKTSDEHAAGEASDVEDNIEEMPYVALQWPASDGPALRCTSVDTTSLQLPQGQTQVAAGEGQTQVAAGEETDGQTQVPEGESEVVPEVQDQTELGWSDSDESTAAGNPGKCPTPVQGVHSGDHDEGLRFGSAVDLAAQPFHNKWLHDWTDEEYTEVRIVYMNTFCRQQHRRSTVTIIVDNNFRC